MADKGSRSSKIQLYIGADHRGFAAKESIKQFLVEQNITFLDCGNTKHNLNDDYPDFAKKVATNVQRSIKDNPRSPHKQAKGILLCGSAQGMVIAANKFKGIRAAATKNKDELFYLVEDDHINILCIPGESKTSRPLSKKKIKELILTFLETTPSNTLRHKRRIKKIKQIEESNFKKLR